VVRCKNNRASCRRFDRPNCSGLFQQSFMPRLLVEGASAFVSASAPTALGYRRLHEERAPASTFHPHLSLLLSTTNRCVSSQSSASTAASSSRNVRVSIALLPDVTWLSPELSRAHYSNKQCTRSCRQKKQLFQGRLHASGHLRLRGTKHGRSMLRVGVIDISTSCRHKVFNTSVAKAASLMKSSLIG
jgi:hypothetical protein